MTRGGARVFAWGGGGGKMAKFIAEHCASPDKVAWGGGGRGGGRTTPTHFFPPTENKFAKNFNIMHGVGVLSSSQYVTELTTTNKIYIYIQNHRGAIPPPPPVTPSTP